MFGGDRFEDLIGTISIGECSHCRDVAGYRIWARSSCSSLRPRDMTSTHTPQART
jgi:hypothetical protein